MRKWVHRLSEVDPVNRRAFCTACGHVPIRKGGMRGKHKGRGKGRIQHWRCANPARPELKWTGLYRDGSKARGTGRGRKNSRTKGVGCERCGFIAAHPCQLDLHHIDGDRHNYSAQNCETVCANCHRLITYQEGHMLNKYEKDWRTEERNRRKVKQ